MSLDLTFVARQADLQSQAAAMAAASLAATSRGWQLPSSMVTGLFAIASLGSGYNRSKLNEAYQNGFVNGTTGDIMAVRMQMDYLSMQERALRARHSSSIRNKLHAAGRRAHQGEATGMLARVTRCVQDTIAAGARRP
jgi:hypothetical protein